MRWRVSFLEGGLSAAVTNRNRSPASLLSLDQSHDELRRQASAIEVWRSRRGAFSRGASRSQ
jgi:hypothetical protein